MRERLHDKREREREREGWTVRVKTTVTRWFRHKFFELDLDLATSCLWIVF